MKLNTLALVAANAVSLMIAGSAFAAPLAAPTVRVSYADLNIATPAGAARLHSRLRAASERVCGQANFRDLATVSLENACVARTLAGALEQVERTSVVRIARL